MERWNLSEQSAYLYTLRRLRRSVAASRGAALVHALGAKDRDIMVLS